MKQFSLLTALACTVLLLAQCSPKAAKTTTVTTTKPETIATPAGKTYTAAQVAEGQMIFEANCAKCHKLFQPETRTLAQWGRILPSMYKKSRLDAAKAELVNAYILPKAKKG